MPFLLGKVKRLLIPYFFVMFIWVAPISAYYFNWKLSYLFKKYILCIDPSQLWFLWMLFGVFAIVWPIRKMLMEKPAAGWVIVVSAYGVGTIMGRMLPNIFCIWTACQYVPFFYIGMRIRCKEEGGEKRITERVSWYCWIVADLIVFISTVLISHQNGTIWTLMSVGMNFLLHIVGAITAFTTLQTLANHIHWQNSKFFKALSSCSMPIYLFHQQIIYFTICWLNGKVNPWVNAGANFFIALVGSFLISALMMRWKVTRLLIGEKQ